MRWFVFVACVLGPVGLSLSNVARGQQSEGPLLLPPSSGDDSSAEQQPNAPRFNGVIRPAENGNAVPRPWNDRNTFGGPSLSPTPAPPIGIDQVERGDLPADPEIRQIAIWYQKFFDHEMLAFEQQRWRDYLDRRGTLAEIPALLLGSEQFFDRWGGEFESWIIAVGEVTGRPVDERDLAQMARDFRRHGNRVLFVRQFLANRGPREAEGGALRVTGYQPAPRPEEAGRLQHENPNYSPTPGTFGDRYYYGNGQGAARDSWNLSPLAPENHGAQNHGAQAPVPRAYGGEFHGGPPRHDEHPYFQGAFPGGSVLGPFGPHAGYDRGHADHGRGHGHVDGRSPARPSRGGRPGGKTEPELIAGWYQTFFNRNVTQAEMRKWMSDRRKGISLEDVFASIIAAPPWYQRLGNTPRGWISGTLEMFGERDRDEVEDWLRRFEHREGDRYEIAQEMVDRFGIRPRVRIIDGPDERHVHDDHDHDDHDDDDRDRRERRRERFDHDD